MKKYFIGFWLVLLLIIEWVADLITQMWGVFHSGVRDLALALDKKYNELNEPDRKQS